MLPEISCPTTFLGEGRFGQVYRGMLSGEVTSKASGFDVVAVKKLDDQVIRSFEDWQSVVSVCGGLSHHNLVKLLGYCWEDQTLYLVHEYMPKGSLENHLFREGSVVQPLPWSIRLNILLGAARGLAFLHTSKRPTICQNFMTSNILLDDSFNPKISDFVYGDLGSLESTYGYVPARWSRSVWGNRRYVAPENIATGKYGDLDDPESDCGSVPTRWSWSDCGYTAYVAPEYVATGHSGVEGDVYSFGVVVIEMLTELRASDRNHPRGCKMLKEWFTPYSLDMTKLAREMEYPLEAATRLAALALQCLGDYPKQRPSMEQVVETLEHINLL